MEKQNYSSNSKFFKEGQGEPDRKIEKIVSGVVTQSKKSFVKMFFENDIQSVGRHILSDVLIPELKKAIADIVKRVTDGATDMLFYGDSAGRPGDRRGIASKVAYTNYYDRRDSSRSRSEDRSDSRERYDFTDLVFNTRKDVEDVIDRVREIVEQYGFVRVADLYDLAGIPGTHTDFGYGWTDVAGMRYDRTRSGYVLRLPRAMPID